MFSEIGRNSDLTTLSIRTPDGTDASLGVTDQEMNHLRFKARMIPTAKNWLSWARWVAGQEWKRCGDFAHPPMLNQKGEDLAVHRVTVHFRRLDFDGKTGIHSASQVASYSVDVRENPRRGAL